MAPLACAFERARRVHVSFAASGLLLASSTKPALLPAGSLRLSSRGGRPVPAATFTTAAPRRSRDPGVHEQTVFVTSIAREFSTWWESSNELSRARCDGVQCEPNRILFPRASRAMGSGDVGDDDQHWAHARCRD